MPPNAMLQNRPLAAEVMGHCWKTILIQQHTETKLVWYAACHDVSGAGILDTKVAIVGRGDGATFAKKTSICPAAGHSNQKKREVEASSPVSDQEHV